PRQPGHGRAGSPGGDHHAGGFGAGAAGAVGNDAGGGDHAAAGADGDGAAGRRAGLGAAEDGRAGRGAVADPERGGSAGGDPAGPDPRIAALATGALMARPSFSGLRPGPAVGRPPLAERAEPRRTEGEAFGGPGIPPRWTRGGKDAIGTAYAASSRVWFTLAQGTLTEVYFPTVDRPQIRDLQFLFSDGATFFHGERRDLDHQVESLGPHALGYRITSADRQGRYRCHKEVIADPHLSAVLVRARLEVAGALARSLRLFVLAAPHLDGTGWNNSAEVAEVAGRTLLLGHRNGSWMAVGATAGLTNPSVGFVGASDGWTDIAEHLAPTFHFASASDGNVALTAEVAAAAEGQEFTLGLAFGDSRQAAINTLLQSLEQPYAPARERFLQQWERAAEHLLGAGPPGRGPGAEARSSVRHPLEAGSSDGGALYRRSVAVMLAHEDKTYPGALIASLSIPWGEAKGDEDLGGYHLVWTRDMVNSARRAVAASPLASSPLAQIYLAAAQHEDGGFAQNFWINGTPYWQGIQLDEVAF